LKTTVPSALRTYKRGRNVVRDDDPYKPYPELPDTARNRLLAFIAKWSPETLAFEKGAREQAPKPNELLDDRSLAKWESCDPENPQGVAVLDVARLLVQAAYPDGPPVVLDPFSGGGAIPLEVGRLGGAALANDYNPVAYLLLRATCEYPQRYGNPGERSVQHEELGRLVSQKVRVANVLTHDFEHWARWILKRAFEKVGHLYPTASDGNPVVAYLWARTVPCPNPQCHADVPLIRTLMLRSDKSDPVALRMGVDKLQKHLWFDIARGKAIRETEGTKKQRGAARCPFCDQYTVSEEDMRTAGVSGTMRARLMAAVCLGKDGKHYRPILSEDFAALDKAEALHVDSPKEFIVPEINSPSASPKAGSHRSINLELYGFTRWGQLFSRRQLVVLQAFLDALSDATKEMQRAHSDSDYVRALRLYLALWLDRIAAFSNTMCRWAPGSEIIKTPFGGQSVPMMWDYLEANPFSGASGSAETQLGYMLDVIAHERSTSTKPTPPQCFLGSATALPLAPASCDCVVTDPPYGNSIAYADLSDFFYVWLKRSLGDAFPEAFTTPQTPKVQEATSHKHRHEGSAQRANEKYRELLTASFAEAKKTTRPPHLVSVMFAHQSTDAWAALLTGLFDAGLAPDATWPIATEMPNTALAMGTASLETSVTVVCRPRLAGSAAGFREVKREIDAAVKIAVSRFWSYGFRGADLIVSCYGPAVGVFSKYERVERGDGTPVGIAELLEIARAAARDAIAGEFRADGISTLYYVWATLYGAGEQAWDDARLVVQIGGDAENAMEVARNQGLFVIDGSSCRLALLADRQERRGLGIDRSPPLIDALHRVMLLWKQEKRRDLVQYLQERELLDFAPFWKLAQALFEVLPRDSEDWKIVNTLLSERPTLKVEGLKSAAQTQLFGSNR
jgi:adenine-specific DNA methylase